MFWPSQWCFSILFNLGHKTVQFFIFSWGISCIILSSHLCLSLPLDRAVRGVQLNILTVLESGILCMWLNQLRVRALMWLIIFWCFISLSNSSLVLFLHNWFSLVGPNIFRRIFPSNINTFWFEDSRSLLVLLLICTVLISNIW